MKFLLLALLATTSVLANVPRLQDAPIEWLITRTIQSKINNEHHIKTNDKTVQNILAAIDYNEQTDEITLRKNSQAQRLKSELISYLSTKQKTYLQTNKDYQNWLTESSSPIHTKLYKTKFKIKGHYYFNHVHTKISQDNSSVDFLKISPTRTFNLVETFLKRRSYKGSLALCDHDTDKGFDEINKLDQTYLSPLRSVEWGGKTHMALIGIKTNWDNLANGRKYSGEESIIQSRSSNGFRIINHPNKKTPPFPYTSWLDVDGVEVWNTSMESPPFTRLNIKYSNNKEAFKQWTDSLSKGHNYVAMAGSDFHFIIPCYTERTLIYPVNFIPAANKEATKDYLQAGRSSFTTVPAAPNLTLQAKFIQNKTWKHMGENAKGAGFLSVRLYGDFSHTNKRLGGRCYNTIRRFSKLFTFWKKRKWEARFYNKKGDLIAKQAFNPKWYNYKKHLKIEFQYPVSSNDLIRVELWSINRKMKSIALLGATNPVYINRN